MTCVCVRVCEVPRVILSTMNENCVLDRSNSNEAENDSYYRSIMAALVLLGRSAYRGCG